MLYGAFMCLQEKRWIILHSVHIFLVFSFKMALLPFYDILILYDIRILKYECCKVYHTASLSQPIYSSFLCWKLKHWNFHKFIFHENILLQDFPPNSSSFWALLTCMVVSFCPGFAGVSVKFKLGIRGLKDNKTLHNLSPKCSTHFKVIDNVDKRKVHIVHCMLSKIIINQ